MLERLDIGKVLDAARRSGYSDISIYCESKSSSIFEIFGRYDSVKCNRVEGIAIHFSHNGVPKTLTTNQISTEAILELLENKTPTFRLESHSLEPVSASSLSKEKLLVLRSALRKTGTDLDATKSPTLRYQEEIRSFEIAESKDVIFKGEESRTALFGNYLIKQNDFTRAIEKLKVRSSEALFWSEFDESSLQPDLPLSWFNPWPAPTGVMPIYWESKALSKLLLSFLRNFEGDRILQKRSALNHIDGKLPLAFSLIDRCSEKNKIDHEGAQRNDILLLEEGRPLTVACDLQIAKCLKIKPTAHCRRESYLSHPTVGLWNVSLDPLAKTQKLLSTIEQGVRVKDLEIVRYNPIVDEIEFEVTESNLILGGEFGEALAAVRFKLGLTEILSSLLQFDPTTSCYHGFFIPKNAQSILTEIECPSAVSFDLNYPGQVSKSHYW